MSSNTFCNSAHASAFWIFFSIFSWTPKKLHWTAYCAKLKQLKNEQKTVFFGILRFWNWLLMGSQTCQKNNENIPLTQLWKRLLKFTSDSNYCWVLTEGIVFASSAPFRPFRQYFPADVEKIHGKKTRNKKIIEKESWIICDAISISISIYLICMVAWWHKIITI